ncbi:MAG: pantoate--beta-alanine ligase [Balneolaceae bacterium]|nr:pantoate--beta-alanine ligase [Balneolaceae bacterium]
MDICKTIDETRETIRKLKAGGKRIALVPTMGALHPGHLSLIRLGRRYADHVVVSIFVNPAQFGPNEDFDTYPRELEEDIKKCRKAEVSLVFAPDKDEIYDDESFFTIRINRLNEQMCGASRPGFFEGVMLIVNKLFNIITPDVAVFGQKDIQQFQMISRMIEEFNHDIELVMGAIQRANDGLALSSRNAYLSTEERTTAPGLYRALQYIEKQIKSGVHKTTLLIDHQKSELEAKGFKIDYISLFSLKTLEPAGTLQHNQKYILAGAVWLGKTRLIDNILIEL